MSEETKIQKKKYKKSIASKRRKIKKMFKLLFLMFFLMLSQSYSKEKPTLHMIGLFHTITSREYSHCAFTAKVDVSKTNLKRVGYSFIHKVLKFARMMQKYGWKIIEYGNAYTESGADEFVKLLDESELKELLTRKSKDEVSKKKNEKLIKKNKFSLTKYQLVCGERCNPWITSS